MNSSFDYSFELNNNQRKYFGLLPIENGWEKLKLNSMVYAYFDNDRIVKIINYGWGYLEYDTIIDTLNREFLLPKTSRGKQQKLSVANIFKIKGSGVQFSGSFQGGGIHVYDNNRNLFFIKSFVEDGDIKNYEDIEKWIEKYIAKLPADYFKWLANELTQKKQKVKIEAGDFIAFKLSSTEYGFARVISNIFLDLEKKNGNSISLSKFHPRSLIVAPYAFIANTPNIEIENLEGIRYLPSVCIFDLDVYRGEMPVIGHKSLSEKDKLIPFPAKAGTAVTLNITMREMQAAIANNLLE